MNLKKLTNIRVFGDPDWRGNCPLEVAEQVSDIELSELMSLNNATHDSIIRRSKIHGVGVNDSNYIVTTYRNGKRIICPAYRSWHDMMTRGYCKKLKIKHPSYIGVTVCDDWHYFSKFRKWWVNNHVQGWHLDKDLIKFKNKIYSAETCVFVPQHLNKLITDHSLARGKHKIGVGLDNKTGMFKSRCWSQITNKRESLGLFKTESEAHAAWLSKKIETVNYLKPEMDFINPKIYENVMRIIKEAV